MSGAPSFVEQALRHHWKGVLVLAALAALPLSWLLSTVPQTTYRVTQGYVVAAVAEDGGRVVTANSDRAARNYAAVLRADESLVTEVAREADVAADDVRAGMSAGYVPGAGTLFVRYEAQDRRQVLDVLAALDRILSVRGASAGGIPSGAVTPLGVPAVEELGLPIGAFPGSGLLLALLGAAAAALLLERLRPRVVTPAQVRAASRAAVVSLDGPDGLDRLVSRLLASRRDRVLVHGLSGADGDEAADLAAALTLAGVRAEAAGELSSEPASWVLVAELPGPQRLIEDAVEQLGEPADVVVAVRTSLRRPVPA